MPDTSKSSSENANPWLLALGAFIVGVVLTAAWFLEAELPRAGELPLEATSSAPAGGAASTATPSTGIVAVHDQPAGSTATVDAVQVPAPGVWVAVEELRDGSLGNVLGAARVPAPAAQVVVNLLRATVPGATYAVVLYRDNGDGEFDTKSDSVYVDFNTGERVVALFKTTL